jgi:hypothetical protein
MNQELKSRVEQSGCKEVSLESWSIDMHSSETGDQTFIPYPTHIPVLVTRDRSARRLG